MKGSKRREYSDEDKPSQCCFGDETQYDVDSFAVKVVSPASYTLILQDHVEGENVEHSKVNEEY